MKAKSFTPEWISGQQHKNIDHKQAIVSDWPMVLWKQNACGEISFLDIFSAQNMLSAAERTENFQQTFTFMQVPAHHNIRYIRYIFEAFLHCLLYNSIYWSKHFFAGVCVCVCMPFYDVQCMTMLLWRGRRGQSAFVSSGGCKHDESCNSCDFMCSAQFPA